MCQALENEMGKSPRCLGIAPGTVGFTEWVFAKELEVTTYFFALMKVKPQRWRPHCVVRASENLFKNYLVDPLIFGTHRRVDFRPS